MMYKEGDLSFIFKLEHLELERTTSLHLAFFYQAFQSPPKFLVHLIGVVVNT